VNLLKPAHWVEAATTAAFSGELMTRKLHGCELQAEGESCAAWMQRTSCSLVGRFCGS